MKLTGSIAYVVALHGGGRGGCVFRVSLAWAGEISI